MVTACHEYDVDVRLVQACPNDAANRTRSEYRYAHAGYFPSSPPAGALTVTSHATGTGI